MLKAVMTTEISARDFEARYRELLAERGSDRRNAGCVQCVECEACTLCTFCRGSTDLVRSHYCIDSKRLIECSHCRRSEQLLYCHHCAECQNCTSSSYLVRCSGLSNCTYCFGCTGLHGKDFHILNEPYDRSAYFAITRRLMRELRLG